MDSRIERDFMGLSRRNGSEVEAERMNNSEQPHGEREKTLGLSLFQEAEKFTGLQLSSGSFGGLTEAIGKAGNANGSGKASVPNTSMQWTYWTKAAALQQFMSCKNYQEERPEKRKFNQLVTSGLQPVATVDTFKSNHRSTSASQKSFNFGPISKDNAEFRNCYSGANFVPNQHFGVHPANFSVKAFDDQSFCNHSIEQAGDFLREKASHSPHNFREHFSSPASFNRPDSTAALGGKLLSSLPFKRHASISCGAAASSVGTTPMRADSNLPSKLASAQLTIFYAGTVNVYDNIPPDKAQAIMLSAENGSSIPTKMTDLSQNFVRSTPVPTNGHSRPDTPTICSSRPNAPTSMIPQGQPQKSHVPVPQVHPQKSEICSKPGQSTGVSSSNGELESNQNNGAGSNQQEGAKKIVSALTPNAVIPRALPQARKASLARFLEKRNGRVTPNSSCSTEKSPSHSSLQQEKSFSSMSSFDGCSSPQHDLTSDVLDVKKMSRSDSMAHANHLSLQKAGIMLEERKIAFGARNC